MGRVIRLLFQDPEVLLGLLIYLPNIISIVLTVLVAVAIWNKKLSKKRGIILLGAVLSTLSFLIGNFVNYVVIPQYGVDLYREYIYLIQGNYFVGSVGGLLFSWGLYRYFKNTTVSNSANEEPVDPFITRNV